ncbi:MAG: non-ribosomal peptide synthetase [Clostridiaceae bacterium]|nr:non-ribosomal peptide synthetase [Clostridiaceae bacterium]
MDKTYPLNDYQASMFNVEMKYPGTGICNIGGTLTYHNPVDFKMLSSALNIFIQATPAIRLRLNCNNRLYISDFYPRNFPTYDFSHKSQEEIDLFISKWLSEPFELYDNDLFEYCFLILPGDKQALCMKMHHILGDMVAVFSFLDKLGNIYEQILRGETPDVSEDKRYIETMLHPSVDYKMQDKAKAYFSSIMDYLDSSSSQDRDDSVAESVNYKLPGAIYRLIRDFCAQNRLAPIHVFYAALSIYLSGISSTQDVIIGSVHANRLKKHMDIFGMYANTLPLMVQVQSKENFSELCRRISAGLLKIMRYSAHTTLAQITKENRISGNLFDVSVSYVTEGFLPEIKNGTWKIYRSGHSEVPIRFYIHELGDGIHYEVQYLCSIYTKEYIDSLISHVFHIMEQGVINNPPVEEINLLTDEDIHAYALLNDTADIHNFPTVCELFGKMALQNPDKIALVDENISFTYRQALEMSNQIAHLLEQMSLPKGSVAAIMTGRCAYLPIAMLGVMKAGHAFLPVDPRAPEKVRNASIAECSVLLTLSKYGGDGIFVDKIILQNTGSIDRSESCSAAYRMKTSGSTGTSKTVEISHLSLSARLQWMHNRYGLNRRILQKTVSTFDVSLWELLSIAFGATLVVLPDGAEKLPDKIAQWINEYRIEMVHFVPSMLNAFLAYTRAHNIKCPSLRIPFLSRQPCL